MRCSRPTGRSSVRRRSARSPTSSRSAAIPCWSWRSSPVLRAEHGVTVPARQFLTDAPRRRGGGLRGGRGRVSAVTHRNGAGSVPEMVLAPGTPAAGRAGRGVPGRADHVPLTGRTGRRNRRRTDPERGPAGRGGRGPHGARPRRARRPARRLAHGRRLPHAALRPAPRPAGDDPDRRRPGGRRRRPPRRTGGRCARCAAGDRPGGAPRRNPGRWSWPAAAPTSSTRRARPGSPRGCWSATSPSRCWRAGTAAPTA